MTKADEAVAHVLSMMRRDGRLAYLLGWGSRSFELLTEAYAESKGLNLAKFREDFADSLKPEEI